MIRTKTMKRNTFLDRCRDGIYEIENNGYKPIHIYMEIYSDIQTGYSCLMIDERMNCFRQSGGRDIDRIINWLDENKVTFKVIEKMCHFDNSDPEVRKFIFISNDNFKDAENWIKYY